MYAESGSRRKLFSEIVWMVLRMILFCIWFSRRIFCVFVHFFWHEKKEKHAQRSFRPRNNIKRKEGRRKAWGTDGNTRRNILPPQLHLHAETKGIRPRNCSLLSDAFAIAERHLCIAKSHSDLKISTAFPGKASLLGRLLRENINRLGWEPGSWTGSRGYITGPRPARPDFPFNEKQFVSSY